MELDPRVFFFGGLGINGYRSFQELGLCLWALTFFSDKKLNGYCKCTSSIVFVYPFYARWPSVFDRFWNLFMCAAGELRVRMSISMCL